MLCVLQSRDFVGFVFLNRLLCFVLRRWVGLGWDICGGGGGVPCVMHFCLCLSA